MNIFQEKSYRQAIEKIVSTRKHLDSRMRFSLLAEAMRIQKSYLSKVLKGEANLSSDQLHLGCQYLELNADESRFLQLLLEKERTGIPERKESLDAQVEKIRARNQETRKHLTAPEVRSAEQSGPLGAGEYYIDPLNQLVHIALTIPRYLADPRKLAGVLGVSSLRIESALQTLARLGVISIRPEEDSDNRSKGRLELLQRQVHLPRGSPFYRPWRAQLRLWALQRMQELGAKEAYTFSVVFSTDEATRKEIHEKFLEFLSWAEKRVETGKPERLYQMNFDLFPWDQ